MGWHGGHINPFWNDQHLELNYSRKSFNNQSDIARWRKEGFAHPTTHFTGLLCDIRKAQHIYNSQVIEWTETEYGLKDVVASYCCMNTGVILPKHSNTYEMYRKLFKVSLEDCERIVVFLEDWASGHYFEIQGTPIVNWKRGDYVWWRGDEPHMAANLGTTKRYTLQITGHK